MLFQVGLIKKIFFFFFFDFLFTFKIKKKKNPIGNGGTEIGNNKISNVNIGISDFVNLTKFSLENNVSN